MVKHKLSEDQADVLNVGKSVDPGETSEGNSDYAQKGDSVEALPLPNGNLLVITGVVDGVVRGVEFEPNDEPPK